MQIFNFDKNDQIMYSKEIKSHQIIHLECLTISLRHRARFAGLSWDKHFKLNFSDSSSSQSDNHSSPSRGNKQQQGTLLRETDPHAI